jgi:eukaryotic-like serine/threonine-protein kinase
MTLTVGSDGRIGKYKLIKRLAVGGMADIWLGQEFGRRGYERTVVVKTIRADLVDDEDLIPMLIEEARIAACLKHESIVQMYEVGQEAGVHYLAMEFVFGRDLGQIRDRCLERGVRIPHEHMVTIVCSVLDALYYAHHEATFEGRPLRVIHRDVSPQNVLVGFDGGVKLLDFGIAKAAAQLSRTRAGVLKGKYAYMSPEQVEFKELDQRADVFSTGIVLWEMLTQRRLFYRPSEYDTVQAVLACNVPFARSIRRDIPWALAWICFRALRRSPRWRYSDAARMLAVLRKWDQRDPVVARDQLAQWMNELFDDDLALREESLARARGDPSKHRQLQDAGLELVEEGSRKDSGRPRRPTPIEAGARIGPRPAAPTARSKRAEPPPSGSTLLSSTLTTWRWFLAMLGLLVFLGVSCGVYWGMFYGAPTSTGYAYLTIEADSPGVEITIGDRAVGRTPLEDIVVLPGRHRITGVVGNERETVEVVVPAGQREKIRLNLPHARPRR